MNAISEATDEEIERSARLSQRTINKLENSFNKKFDWNKTNNQKKIKRNSIDLSPQKPPRTFQAKNSITSNILFNEDSKTLNTINDQLISDDNSLINLKSNLQNNDDDEMKTKPMDETEIAKLKQQTNKTKKLITEKLKNDEMILENTIVKTLTESVLQSDLNEITQKITHLNNQPETNSNHLILVRKSSTISIEKVDSIENNKEQKTTTIGKKLTSTTMYANCPDSDSFSEISNQSNVSISSSDFDALKTNNTNQLHNKIAKKVKKKVEKIREIDVKTDVNEKTT